MEEPAFLGKTITSFPILLNTKEGEMVVKENGLIIKAGDKIIVPNGYVEGIEEKKKLPLGKVRAHMRVYEVMGIRHDLELIMAEHNLRYLEKIYSNKHRL
ncbi:MAG: hypothetical protein QXP42_02255 [Candidatus Micrarchaeia archaeon]